MKVARDLRYASGDLTLGYDLISPAGPGSHPLIVFLHGGGWISGERSMYAEEAGWFVERGFAAALIDYRLAPLYPFPAAVADCQAFVRQMRDSPPAGIDPGRIGAMGNSAGGHLALMLGLCRRDLGTGETSNPVDATVAVCPITDLRPSEDPDPIAMGFVEQFMGGPYAGNEERYASASPICHAQLTGPCLLVHGDADDIVDVSQSRTLVRALGDARSEVRYLELAGEQHGFSYPAWERIREEALGFFRTGLRVGAPA